MKKETKSKWKLVVDEIYRLSANKIASRSDIYSLAKIASTSAVIPSWMRKLDYLVVSGSGLIWNPRKPFNSSKIIEELGEMQRVSTRENMRRKRLKDGKSKQLANLKRRSDHTMDAFNYMTNPIERDTIQDKSTWDHTVKFKFDKLSDEDSNRLGEFGKKLDETPMKLSSLLEQIPIGEIISFLKSKGYIVLIP